MDEDQFLIGAIKIKDGLFIGDEESIKDLEFILANKITHIINTAGKQIPNTWENIGVQYLTLYWQESDKQILFDTSQDTAQQILEFIEKANKLGESCLVHSMRGQSRACCALTIYFMLKYKWTLFKTLDYLNSRRPDLEIRASFFHQLKDFETILIQQGQGGFSGDWNQEDLSEYFDNEESYNDAILLRNTYLNSKNVIVSNQFYSNNKQNKNLQMKKISWQDEVFTKKKPNSTIRKPSPAPFKRTHQDVNKNQMDSILKGSNKVFQKDTGEQLIETNNEIFQNENKKITKEFQIDDNQRIIQQQQQQVKINQLNGNIINLTVNNFVNTNKNNDQNMQKVGLFGKTNVYHQMDFLQQKNLQKQRIKQEFSQIQQKNGKVLNQKNNKNTFLPIKANVEIVEKRPNSANYQNNNIYNNIAKSKIQTNNFINNQNIMYQENQNKRPSSSEAGQLRSFSPGIKNNPKYNQNKMVICNNNSKKSGIRYPSPQINLNQNQLQSTQKKWK